MSFLATLGIKATVKGVSGLFRTVKGMVKDFKSKRKAEAQKFSDDLLNQAGSLSFANLNSPTVAGNPLGVTAKPEKKIDSSLSTESPKASFTSFDMFKGGKEGNKMIYYIGAGIGALALIFIATKKKRR